MFTVTTPAEDRSLLTAAEARAAIGNAEASGQQITQMVARVSAAIARACKVAASGAVPPTLRIETLTETYRLKSHQDCLILSRRPVVEIVSVTENDSALAIDDYEVDASSGLLYRLNDGERACWPCTKVVVVNRAGWESVPEDLKEAAAKLARVLWAESERSDPSLKRESIPGVIEREWWVGPKDDPLIPAEIMDLLQPYMNHWVG